MLENHQQKNSDRCSLPFGTPVPVLPVRNNLRRPNSTHFPPSRFQFRKSFTNCSWKRTAIIFIILSVVLLAAVTYMLGKWNFISFHWFDNVETDSCATSSFSGVGNTTVGSVLSVVRPVTSPVEMYTCTGRKE